MVQDDNEDQQDGLPAWLHRVVGTIVCLLALVVLLWFARWLLKI